jgi:hypothetical protein
VDPFLEQMLWGLVPTLVAMSLVLFVGRKKVEAPIPGLALWFGLLAGAVGLLRSWPAFPPKTGILALPYVVLISLLFLFASEKKWARRATRVAVVLAGTILFLNPYSRNVFEGKESLFWMVLLGLCWFVLAPVAVFGQENRPRYNLLLQAILSVLLGVGAALTGSLFLGQLAGILGVGMVVLFLFSFVAGPNFRSQGIPDFFAMFFTLCIALTYLASSTPAGIAILYFLAGVAPLLLALRPKGQRPLWLFMAPSLISALAATLWAFWGYY